MNTKLSLYCGRGECCSMGIHTDLHLEWNLDDGFIALG